MFPPGRAACPGVLRAHVSLAFETTLSFAKQWTEPSPGWDKNNYIEFSLVINQAPRDALPSQSLIGLLLAWQC